MDVNGCHIVNSLNADAPDGFVFIVSRYVGRKDVPPTPVPPELVKVSKGPFFDQGEAVKYARSWSDASNPPAIPPHKCLVVNGATITADMSGSAPDGFASNVTRIVTMDVVPEGSSEGASPVSTETTISRGPFPSLRDAVAYAKDWNDHANPPAMTAQ